MLYLSFICIVNLVLFLSFRRAQMSASDNEGDSSDDDSEEVYSGPSAPR